MRIAREERGIPLREISDQTRIQVRYLEAIETNDYKRLPGGIFNRSFVKAYAKYVGYDEKEAVEAYTRYMRDQGDTGDEVGSTPFQAKVYTDMPATRSPVLTLVLAIVILAILSAIALAVMKWGQRRAAAEHQPVLVEFTSDNVAAVVDDSFNAAASSHSWKADYENARQ